MPSGAPSPNDDRFDPEHPDLNGSGLINDIGHSITLPHIGACWHHQHFSRDDWPLCKRGISNTLLFGDPSATYPDQVIAPISFWCFQAVISDREIALNGACMNQVAIDTQVSTEWP